mmetsp:Transcript_90532/g.252014  ORF Transcript_90532/g.252014 Transcript_90532/m.252014 type:complete len:242 (-) Transcript_90532:722-1447(-)
MSVMWSRAPGVDMVALVVRTGVPVISMLIVSLRPDAAPAERRRSATTKAATMPPSTTRPPATPAATTPPETPSVAPLPAGPAPWPAAPPSPPCCAGGIISLPPALTSRLPLRLTLPLPTPRALRLRPRSPLVTPWRTFCAAVGASTALPMAGVTTLKSTLAPSEARRAARLRRAASDTSVTCTCAGLTPMVSATPLAKAPSSRLPLSAPAITTVPTVEGAGGVLPTSAHSLVPAKQVVPVW